MFRKFIPALAALGILALPAAVSPASAATPTANSCDSNWTLNKSWGRANGRFCDNDQHLSGTVKDTAADGRCPYVRGHILGGGFRDSDWAGPKGDSSPVELWAPDGRKFEYVELRYIDC
ncbi:hypothetical protein HET69_05335 [Streptomyces sp. CJ_13]|uniref:hypothetical protein n=1 Tax=Streptomyces sp. CJ_13 TaxID=2724943 RepID=UPI001BDD2329|nr:hypothetical protein [Streptomyces sp. CJ_13]MBT1183442.1 hypothetical protein [Streptomyces sp. CJ_13]